MQKFDFLALTTVVTAKGFEISEVTGHRGADAR